MGRRKKITEADIKGEPPKPRRKRRTDYYNGTKKGAYTLIRPEKYMLREAVVQVECPECHGTGLINGQQCPRCGGKGVIDQVVVHYKSDWERKFCVLCDGNEKIIRWAYEPFEIPYSSPVMLRQSLYRPDIYLEISYDDGHIEKWLIEIKPVSYSVVPKPPKPLPPGCSDYKKIMAFKKKMSSFQQKSMDIATNYAKWQAAESWCNRNMVNWFIANETNTRGLFNGNLNV